MRRSAKILAGVLAAALAASVIAAYLTRDSAPGRAPAQVSAVDGRLLDTARQMASLAESPREQEIARNVARQADHELDQSFASAVREAAAAKPPTTGPVAQLNARIAQIRQRIAAGQDRIARLSKNSGDGNAAQIEVAKAQMDLDQDELEDAQQDLVRQGGDERTRLERARQEHTDAQKETVAPAKAPSTQDTSTLALQVQTWLVLGNRRSQVMAARAQAVARGASLEREHNSLEALLSKKPVPAPAPDVAADEDNPDEEDNDAMLARLRQLSDQRKTLPELDRRVQDCQQLAEQYRSWSAILDARRMAVAHQLAGSMALVFGVLLVVVAAEAGVHHALKAGQDRRRNHQKRFLIGLALRVAGALAILLIVFGPPSQTPTIIGLATAGMTVVLKDFIVGFFGWFVLAGRNGVRVGDWVEIQGVGGEVIEVGLFKTVLLEMGNWTNTGHPTGRRVSFMNGYAIEGHYFNFSTAGQWLWDELQVTVPAAGDPYDTAARIREAVERETEADALLAEQDWERITRQYGTRAFSARPAVDLRPAANGLDIHVRYITRGPQRYEMKSKLFREIVSLLHGPGAAGAEARSDAAPAK